jgi:serine/threonine protein kinase
MQHGFETAAHVHAGSWRMGAAIARGSWGRVHTALNTVTDTAMAAKCIDCSGHSAATAGVRSDKLQSMLTEVYLLRRLHHPNIVRCVLARD